MRRCDGKDSSIRHHSLRGNSQAALRGLQDDAPGAGQQAARAATSLISQQGSSITLGWVPAHRGVTGDEKADYAGQAAKEASCRKDLITMAFLKKRRTETATRAWGEEIKRRNGGRRLFVGSREVRRLGTGSGL